jgi:hypothetical protein
MARSDKALLAAFLLAAGLGTWTRCLLLNDGAVFMSAGWLGDAWHLYFHQIAGRAVSAAASDDPEEAFGAMESIAGLVFAFIMVVTWIWLAVAVQSRLRKTKALPAKGSALIMCQWIGTAVVGPLGISHVELKSASL